MKLLSAALGVLILSTLVSQTASGAAAPAAAAAAATSAPSPLVAQWHMDEVDSHSDGPSTTPDSSGNGSDLRIVTPNQVPGRFDEAFNFTGSKHDSLSTVGTQFHQAQLTTMAWVKGTGSPGQYKAVVEQGGTNDCNVASYALYTGAGGGLSFYIATNRSTTVNSAAIAPASIWDGQWHAVAGTYDGSSVRLYVDGTEVGTPTVSNGAAIDYDLDDDTFDIGNYHDADCAGAFDFTGAIDEVRVYDRALSAAEVGDLQSSTATTPPVLGQDSTSTQTVCAPTTTTVGGAINCMAMVSDTAATPQGAPTGSVAFSSDNPGTFSPTSCTLGSPQGATSTCSVTYTPTAAGSGLHHVAAIYTSDAGDTASDGVASVTVTGGAASPAPPAATQPSPTPPAPIAPPQAAFTAPATVTPGMPVTLNAGATTGATSLVWSVNGHPAAVCNAATPAVTLTVSSASTVSLSAFGFGGSSTKNVALPLAPGTKPVSLSSLRYVAATTVCSGGAPTADTTAAGGPPPGCTTAVTAGIVSAVGCLTEVTDPTKVPGPEAGILTAMLSDYQQTPAAQADGAIHCVTIVSCNRTISVGLPGFRPLPLIERLELYLSTSPVRIDGVDFTPLPGATIAISPGLGRVVSSNAVVTVQKVPITVGKINLDVGEKCSPTCGNDTLPIASFDSRGIPALADFPFTGSADISFVQHGIDHYSEIDGHIQLPASLGGISIDGHLRADNTNAITPENFHVHVDSIGYGGVGLSDVDIYFAAPDDWAFYGNLGIGTATVRLVPTPTEPYNGIVFHKGTLDHAGATLDLTADPPEIAPGVQLEKLGLAFALNPTALRGSVTLNALGVADITGNVVVAFPRPDAPFKAGPTDLPNAPAKLLNQTYTSGPLFGVGGTVDVEIPDLGEVGLGSGYLLYDAPGYIAAGGSTSVGIKDVFYVQGQFDGEFNVTNRRFNLLGNVKGCVADLCVAVGATLSDSGAAICAGDWGAGVFWHDLTPHIFGIPVIGVDCKLAEFEDDNVYTGHLRGSFAAGAPQTLVVKRGQPLPEVRLVGAGGAPNVTMTGPDGTVLTADGLGVHEGGHMIAIQTETGSETVLGITDPVPGTYTVTPLPGPAVVSSAHATVPADASVHGNVTGTGTRRVLHYQVAKLPGERITFSEVNHGISREIGSTTGGKGTLTFTTVPGPGTRTIVAADSRDGMSVPDAQQLFVAHFSGPAFVKPGKPGAPKVSWSHGALAVSWKPAAHVASYRITLRERKGGTTVVTSRKPGVRISSADAALAGSVSVVAVSTDGTRGPGSAATYKAAHAAVSRFLPFSELRGSVKKPGTPRKPGTPQKAHLFLALPRAYARLN